MSDSDLRFADNITVGLPESKGQTLLGMPKKTAERERSPFGLRMYQARKAKGLTIEEAAAKVGVRASTLSQAENSGQGTALLIQFSDLYGVSPRWLALGEGAKEQSAPALSTEVADYAQQIERIIQTDPDPLQRRFTYIMMTLAVIEAPRTPERMLELTLRLTRELQPS